MVLSWQAVTRLLKDTLTSWALPHGKSEASFFLFFLSNDHVSERRVKWLKITLIVKTVMVIQLETQTTLQGRRHTYQMVGIPEATKALMDRTHRDKCFCAHPITSFNTHDSPKLEILLSLFYTG